MYRRDKGVRNLAFPQRACGNSTRFSYTAIRVGRELNYPEFSFMRSDPRLNALRRNVGLPE
jgi:hypothetical protein